MAIDIIKSTGQTQSFSKNKLCLSLRKAGAPKNLADVICNQIGENVVPGMSTTQIFRQAFRYLAKKDMPAAARYNLRRGIGLLGPTGFIFEQYIEAVLQSEGYKTRRNVMMRGQCVTHEVDVVAEKDRVHYLLEMKYHNEPGIITHINTVMYADARLVDISKVENKRENNKNQHRMWVVTNTKFTDTAVQYAKCRGLKLTGWNYPKGESLEDLVARTKTFPVTILPSATPVNLAFLVAHNIVLAQDLISFTPEELNKLSGLPVPAAQKIIKEAQDLFD